MEDNITSWRKSSFSGNGGGSCVEVAHHDGLILVRDTKDRSKAPHRFTRTEWEAFTAGVRAGEFDLDESGRLP